MAEQDSDEQAAEIDRALLDSQRQEREEREADLLRQQRTDEEIVRKLTERDSEPTDSGP